MAIEYVHSHVYTEVRDNSAQAIAVTNGGTAGFFPIFSDKGKENEIVLIDQGVNSFVNQYGADASRFGQAHLNVIQWLIGGGSAYIMRLLPEDASIANTSVIVNVQSYQPDYRVTLKIRDNEDMSVTFRIKENVYMTNGLVPQLVAQKQRTSDGKLIESFDNAGLDPETDVPLFATGRGTDATDKYFLVDDWLRNNGLAAEKIGEDAEESTGMLPVKSYVNYKAMKDLAQHIKTFGTKCLSPKFISDLLGSLARSSNNDIEGKVKEVKNGKSTVKNFDVVEVTDKFFTFGENESVPTFVSQADGEALLAATSDQTLYKLTGDLALNEKFVAKVYKLKFVDATPAVEATDTTPAVDAVEAHYEYELVDEALTKINIKNRILVAALEEASLPFIANSDDLVPFINFGSDGDANTGLKMTIGIDYDGTRVNAKIVKKTGTFYKPNGKDIYGDPDFSTSSPETIEYFELVDADSEQPLDLPIINEDPETNSYLYTGYYSKFDYHEDAQHPETVTSSDYNQETLLCAASKPLDVLLRTIAVDYRSIAAGDSEGRTIKEVLFAEPDKINVYFDLSRTIVDYDTMTSLADLIEVDIVDKQFVASYFMDSYPVQTYSEYKKIAGKVWKVWNAKITVTDSDGYTKDIVLFRNDVTKRNRGGVNTNNASPDNWIPKFTQEDYIFRALDGLVNYKGKWTETAVTKTVGYEADGITPIKVLATQKLRGFKTAFFFANGKDESAEDYNPCLWKDADTDMFICLKDMNYDDLCAANYSGNKQFTRMNSDRVNVELYSVPAKKALTVDGIKENIKSYVNNFNNNISNLLNGKRKYPVGVFASRCKGSYYNDFKIYIEPNDSLKDTYPDFRLYDITVYDTANNQTRVIDGPYTVSFDKDAIDRAGNSYYIKNIFDTYSNSDFRFYDDIDVNAWKNCCEDLSSLFRLNYPMFAFDNAAVDPLFIPQVNEAVLAAGNPDYEYHSYFATTDDESIPEDQRTLRIQGSFNIQAPDSVNLSNGFNLANGSEGTLYDKRGNMIKSVKKNLLIKAFNGGITPDVYDIKNYEFDVIMDAGYDNVVKKAMVQLASSLRKDCFVVLDTDNMSYRFNGPATSAARAIQVRKDFAVSDYAVAIFAQNTTAYDEYSSVTIPVSATYLLSYKIPYADNSTGIQNSFVGPRRGTVELTGPMNWYPNEAEKERLYKAQVNYISKDIRRTAFDCQLTSQTFTSALSNIPNVRVLFKIKRAVEKICDDYRFEKNISDTRNDLSAAINSYLKEWTDNGACTSASANVSATDYEIKNKMCSVTLDLVFVGFLERIKVTINVNG